MRRVLAKYAIPLDLWKTVTDKIPLLSGLDPVEMAHLRALSAWFLAKKTIHGAQGFEVTPEMKVVIAAQACLLILHLGTDYFEGWVGVTVYPGAFRVKHEEQDEFGLVHQGFENRSGESWLKGPVILSWEDVRLDSREILEGRNVVLHEFAHKLDGMDGSMNGVPPLHSGMERRAWHDAFVGAYEALCREVDSGGFSSIDPYATTSPAEFFAVVTEYFFTAPAVLEQRFPEVFGQLALFYLGRSGYSNFLERDWRHFQSLA
ncbi:MAG: zinc-dependent peptidase [Burkholderiales bacterium]|nr:zinc-dependent peptidase [Burkholderiales bacterium]